MSAPDVLALVGSARRGGNTDTLVEALLAPVREAGLAVTKLYLHELGILPCLACGGCAASGVCAREDGLTSALDLLRGARALVVGSPMYCGTVSAQTKALMDRCGSCCLEVAVDERGTKRFRSRLRRPAGQSPPGAVVAVCDLSGPAELEAITRTMEGFVRDVGYRPVGRACGRGLSERGDVLKRPELLQNARQLGERLTAECQRSVGN